MLRRIQSDVLKKLGSNRLSQTLKNQNRGPIPSDVNGSYTGTARNGDVPEQDADDL